MTLLGSRNSTLSASGTSGASGMDSTVLTVTRRIGNVAGADVGSQEAGATY